MKEGQAEDVPRWQSGLADGEDETDAPATGTNPNVRPLRTQVLTLDAGGAAQAHIDGLPPADVPLDLVAEMEYNDPNGEMLTRSARFALWPAAVLLGVKPTAGRCRRTRSGFQVVAVATDGARSRTRRSTSTCSSASSSRIGNG